MTTLFLDRGLDGREHVFAGVAAEPPDFVLAVSGGGVHYHNT